MIQTVFQFITTELEQYLRRTLSLNDNHVISNAIINADGSIPIENQNKLVLSFLNLQQEASRSMMTMNRASNSANLASNKPEHYSIQLLVTSNFDDYIESLKFLDHSINFFQKQAVISHDNTANLPQGLLKLNFQLEDTSDSEMQKVWTMLGAKYQPSVVYKLRVITE